MTYADLKDKHAGKTAVIIGKGPSLDDADSFIDEIDKGDNVIFALNESIHAVETDVVVAPLYCVQQDWVLGRDCVPKFPNTIHLMNSWQSPGPENPHAYHKRVAVSRWNPDAVLYDFPETDFSAVAALKIAKHMGCTSVVFCCFDSWRDEKIGQYAGCIGKDSGALGDPARHAVNGAWIRSEAARIFEKYCTRHPDTGV